MLNLAFSLKHLGELDYFFGIEVKQAPHGSLFLTHSKYIKDLLHNTNMTHSCSVNTQMQSTCKLTKHGSTTLIGPYMYKSVVGAL